MQKGLCGLKRALVFGTLAFVPSCSLGGLFGNDGARVQVELTRDGGGSLSALIPGSEGGLVDRDKDESGHGFFRFQAATVRLSSILARTHDGELVDLDVDLPIDVDVVRIDGGRTLLLPDGFLPPDTYDQVVFVITAVRGELRDGTLVTIEPAGGGWTSVVPICPLEVVTGETTTVGIAFNVRDSFIQLGNSWSFHPRFRSLRGCDHDDDDDDDKKGA